MENKENKEQTKQQIIQYLQKENNQLRQQNKILQSKVDYIENEENTKHKELQIAIEETKKAKIQFDESRDLFLREKEKMEELYKTLKINSIKNKKRIDKFFKKNKIDE